MYHFACCFSSAISDLICPDDLFSCAKSAIQEVHTELCVRLNSSSMPTWNMLSAMQDSSQVDVAAQALTHIINDNPRNYLSLMHFEKDFCLDCDWRRIDLNASDKVSLHVRLPARGTDMWHSHSMLSGNLN